MIRKIGAVIISLLAALAISMLCLVSCTEESPTEPEGDTQAPTVSLTSPEDGATVTGTVAVNATASDNVAVTRVQFFIDETAVAADSTSPYSYDWDTEAYGTDGDHTVFARASDAAGNTGDSDTLTITCEMPDVTAPADISSLAVQFFTSNSVTLTWTSPGDDGSEGQAAQYDIRYYGSSITEANWNVTTECTGETTPLAAGGTESFQVTGLDASTTYYFAIKTADEVPNWSGLSNVVSATTQETPDETAPDAVVDLTATDSSSTTITVTWTAPGDDADVGTATQYDIRYATTTIDESNWGSATQATSEPTPSVAGTGESHMLTNLETGNKYYIAIKTADEAGNWSAISNVASATCSDAAVVVDFPDPNLDDAIRTAIGKPTGDIMSTDLEGLILLSANGAEIMDLTGIEYCVDLQDLRLMNNYISDVTPLVPLVNLTYLDLYFNMIEDICPLVDNIGLDTGDQIIIGMNSLNSESTSTCIPALEARGVIVDTASK
ncbi:MAG: fibronectin type III domain-containing protein [Candidatus Zixiibacteriota bacterium]|nr:MAG: fibronectin type III domain-containing protein [candidate division Zixibacteria bacterium]